MISLCESLIRPKTRGVKSAIVAIKQKRRLERLPLGMARVWKYHDDGSRGDSTQIVLLCKRGSLADSMLVRQRKCISSAAGFRGRCTMNQICKETTLFSMTQSLLTDKKFNNRRWAKSGFLVTRIVRTSIIGPCSGCDVSTQWHLSSADFLKQTQKSACPEAPMVLVETCILAAPHSPRGGL